MTTTNPTNVAASRLHPWPRQGVMLVPSREQALALAKTILSSIASIEGEGDYGFVVVGAVALQLADSYQFYGDEPADHDADCRCGPCITGIAMSGEIAHLVQREFVRDAAVQQRLAEILRGVSANYCVGIGDAGVIRP